MQRGINDFGAQEGPVETDPRTGAAHCTSGSGPLMAPSTPEAFKTACELLIFLVPVSPAVQDSCPIPGSDVLDPSCQLNHQCTVQYCWWIHCCILVASIKGEACDGLTSASITRLTIVLPSTNGVISPRSKKTGLSSSLD